MTDPEAVGYLEQFGTAVDGARAWFSKAGKIAMLMCKGAYLLTERRRLFGKLGEEVYYKMAKGEWQNAELEPLARQLEKLTKKIEIEEMLIRGIRFGARPARHKRHRPLSSERSPE